MEKTILIVEEKTGLTEFLNFVGKDHKLPQFHPRKEQIDDQGELKSKDPLPAGQVIFLEFTVENLEKIEKFLKRYPSFSVYLAASFKALGTIGNNEMLKLGNENDNIRGMIDLDLNPQFYLPMIRNLFSNWPNDLVLGDKKAYLFELNKNLNKVIENLEGELKRIKKIHEYFMPKRFQNFKGLSAHSKFVVGEGPGGEFFDIVNKDKRILILLTSTNQYQTTAIVLNHFLTLKNQPHLTLDTIKEFINFLFKDLEAFDNSSKEVQNKIAKNKDDKPPLQLFLGLINLTTLIFEGYNFSKTLIVSNLENHFETYNAPFDFNQMDKFYFHHNMARGEKLALLSPGYQLNAKDKLIQENLPIFAKETLLKSSTEFLNELFFQIKRNSVNPFLKYDASSILFEVDQNVLFQA